MPSSVRQVMQVTRSRVLAMILMLAALAPAVAVTGSLAACGSSGGAPPAASPTEVAITAVLPKDAGSEPPWNGRFVQVTVRAAKPEKMAAGDWTVRVNGKKGELDKPPSILPFAPDAATVAFVFREPFGDLGAYRFRVVYSPADGPVVGRSWVYDWSP